MNCQNCQACELRAAEVEEPTNFIDEPFHLCLECNRRLQARALRPVEWFNLAKRHGWQEFLLHDDFYDEDGVALQPKEKVDEPERFPAPTLEAVAQDAELLLDYAITRWSLQQPAISAWLARERSEVLTALSSRFASTGNLLIRSKLLEISALTLRGSGADFVRYAWGDYPTTVALPPLAQASAACLPLAEGFDRVSAALEPEIKKKKWDLIFCLGYFQTPSALNWIEQRVAEPITESWGYLAAASHLDWARVERWLRQGRPLSLVVLDALLAISRPRTLLLKSIRPQLYTPPDLDLFKRELTEYAKKDPAPRIQQRTEVLLKDAESLLRRT